MSEPRDAVPGWFDYGHLYNRLVDEAPPGSTLVEVGVYHGKSLRHLAHRAKAADKGLLVVGVDWGRGSPEHGNEAALLPAGNLAGIQLRTLLTAGVADDCLLLTGPSVLAARLVADGSCHAVFLDADHSKRGVLADIEAWKPKVRAGGVICGHDWLTFPGVKDAVCEAFGRHNWVSPDAPSCWEVRL